MAAFKRLALLSVTVFILVLAALMAFGFWSVWYRSTGYREQFQPAPKPQKAAYTPIPPKIVMTTGIEPDVSSRNKSRLLSNPIAPNKESLELGKDLYMIYCSPCHGKTGDGMGIMGSVPYLGKAPWRENQELSNYLSGYLGYNPNVDLNFVQEETEGDIYYTITNGGEAIMPGFKDALSPEQRWDLINYIKRDLGGQIGE